jgi:chromosome segregation ATPase
LTALESDLRELRRRVEPFCPAHEDHKKVTGMEEEVELLRAEIKELEENKEQGDRLLPLNRERAYAEARVASAQGRMTFNEGKIEAANETIPKLEAELSRLKDSRLESSDLREKEKTLVEDIETYDMRIKEINSIRKSADLELSLQSAASEPYRIQKQSLVGIAIGVVVGLVVGIGGATGIYRRRVVRRVAA